MVRTTPTATAPAEAAPAGAAEAPSSAPGKHGAWPRGPEHILLRTGLVTPEQLQWAADRMGEEGGPTVLQALVEAGCIDEVQVLQAVAADCKLSFMRISREEVDPRVFALLSVKEQETYRAVPIRRDGDTVIVATSDPVNAFLVQELSARLKAPVRLIVTPWQDLKATMEDLGLGKRRKAEEIFKGIETLAGADVEVLNDEVEQTPDLEMLASESPIVQYVDFLIVSAVEEGASDIHIEAEEDGVRVRYRIDGILFEQPAPPAHSHLAIISRVKIIAGLDITERRLPQDGRIRLRVKDRRIDLRISTFPMSYGEKCVMRILDARMTAVGMDGLGMAPDTAKAFREQVAQPLGMVLVTGPTGSGKSTTLYAALRAVDRETMNICTIEDPIEYELPRANQAHVHEDIGFTFAAALRCLLRQDPDVLLVGEVRDEETARIAVQAALTGHLVLSTLHTTDAAASIARLVDIGVEPYLVTASVSAVLAQRLARRICPECREEVETPSPTAAAFLEKLDAHPDTLYRGAGCDQCRQTGYRGRIGLYELLVLDDDLRALISRDPSVTALRHAAAEKGMRTLAKDGILKAAEGLTTVEEVMRVTTV